MGSNLAVSATGLTHRYGPRLALDALDLAVDAGEVFVLLGPNGSGKSTLFRLLSTLIPPQAGSLEILGLNVARDAARARSLLGVVFQSPSLDRKLTVRENLTHQGHLHGLRGRALRSRGDELLARLGLADRARDLVETLSGGLRRRVELAKCLLHQPRLLILDEPSTGLDPLARLDLWNYLQALRTEQGMTIVLTTHLLEEADRADRLAILNAGQLVALDTPARLRSTVGADVLSIQADRPNELADEITRRFGLETRLIQGQIRLAPSDAHRWVPRLHEAFPDRIQGLTLSRPTLEDVLIARTGRRLWEAHEEVTSG